MQGQDTGDMSPACAFYSPVNAIKIARSCPSSKGRSVCIYKVKRSITQRHQLGRFHGLPVGPYFLQRKIHRVSRIRIIIRSSKKEVFLYLLALAFGTKIKPSSKTFSHSLSGAFHHESGCGKGKGFMMSLVSRS